MFRLRWWLPWRRGQSQQHVGPMFRLRWWLPWRRGQSQQHVDWCITDAEVVSGWTLTGATVSDWTLTKQL